MRQMGTLHIRLDRETDTYTVSFAPYASGGGALGETEIHGRDELKTYLLGLGIHAEIIENVSYELQREGRSHIPNVSADG
jgi:hypothetical protein